VRAPSSAARFALLLANCLLAVSLPVWFLAIDKWKEVKQEKSRQEFKALGDAVMREIARTVQK
jgi:hypothetical protein